MTFSLLAPGFLVLLAAVPLLWFVPKKVSDVRHGIIRSLVVAALVLGLCQPVVIDTEAPAHHVVIVDRTASLSSTADSDAALASVFTALHEDTDRTLIEIGTAGTDQKNDQKNNALSGVARIQLPDGRSSLSTALTLAAERIAHGAPGAITLITDGMSTDTHWGPAVQALLARKIPLHTIELGSDAADPRIVDARFDRTIRAGHTAKVRVRLVGRSRDVGVSLHSGEETLAQAGGLQLDGQLDLVLSFEPKQAGFQDVELRLAATGDTRSETNTWTRRIAVQDPLRLLYLGDRMQGGRDKLEGMLGDGYIVTAPKLGDGPELLDATDIAMLDDRPATKLPANWRSGIANAVQKRGMGLLASGGRSAFGSGGYHRTEIEELLPVEFVQKEEKKDPSTTLAIIIDSSGSMVGQRMTLAKQVARLAMRRLQPHDKIGIVEFYGTKSWAAPIQSAANQIDLQRALNRLDAGGGTVLMPAIEEAYYAMKNVQTRYKHVLVLTDAGVETGDYESLLRRMADEGMTVSTVLVGPGRHSDFLVDLADWGGGRYYNATDRFNLPELLLKKPSTSVLPAYRPERIEVETSGGRGWWGDLDPTTVPPLDGFVECELKPGSEELISTKKTDTPVLATRLSGLGRVTAFMSEPLGAGTRTWNEWSGYGTLLGRVLARTARGHQPPFEWSVRRRGDRIRIRARRLVRQPLTPQCFELTADGTRTGELALREVAPGLFEYRAFWPAAKTLEAQAITTRADGAEIARLRLVSGAHEDVAPEGQVDPARQFPMASAAALTGGQSFGIGQTPATELSASAGTAPLQLHLVWPWLVLLALLLFAFDVYHRRTAGGTIA